VSEFITEQEPAVVEMRGITMQFPGVLALDNVDLTLRRGEVHALMGENGAGKSTLIKCLTGVNKITSGSIKIDGVEHRFSGPNEAQAAGIATVYQEVNLCSNLSVAENVMLGHEVRRGPFVNWRATRNEARTYLNELGLNIDPSSTLSSHSIAVQQLCAIARAMVIDAKVLILDEPTSSLDQAEVEQLFGVMRSLRDQGVAILFVSHFLDQVYEISDRMTILRNGKLVGEYLTKDLPRIDLISKMVGREGDVLADIAAGTAQADPIDYENTVPALSAAGVGKRGVVRPFDMNIYGGEVLGIAGLLGSGRTEVARLMYGADKHDTGTLAINGDPERKADPSTSLKRGVAFATEDRKKEGIIGDLTVRENIALAMQADRGALKPIPPRELDEIVDKYIKALGIRPPNPNALVKNLSGGNQQKVLLARWLATNPQVLILDEPTRGIDVGAKAEIQKLVSEVASEGMGVVYISSELEEVLRLSQRIAVMRDRQKIGEITNGPDVNSDTILETIASGGNQ